MSGTELDAFAVVVVCARENAAPAIEHVAKVSMHKIVFFKFLIRNYYNMLFYKKQGVKGRFFSEI